MNDLAKKLGVGVESGSGELWTTGSGAVLISDSGMQKAHESLSSLIAADLITKTSAVFLEELETPLRGMTTAMTQDSAQGLATGILTAATEAPGERPALEATNALSTQLAVMNTFDALDKTVAAFMDYQKIVADQPQEIDGASYYVSAYLAKKTPEFNIEALRTQLPPTDFLQLKQFVDSAQDVRNSTSLGASPELSDKVSQLLKVVTSESLTDSLEVMARHTEKIGAAYAERLNVANSSPEEIGAAMTRIGLSIFNDSSTGEPLPTPVEVQLRAQELGITEEHIKGAVQELKHAAVRDGLDPRQINDGVALEALVLREVALERSPELQARFNKDLGLEAKERGVELDAAHSRETQVSAAKESENSTTQEQSGSKAAPVMQSERTMER